MNPRLETGFRRNTQRICAALLALTLIVALALACGSGGGGSATPECLDTLYAGTMNEETRKQLSQPISKMNTEERLEAIKALSHQGTYSRNAASPECSGFVQELELWEETSDGQKWHEENGEQIASQAMSFLGVRQCKDGVNYDYLKDFAGDIKLLKSKVSVVDSSFSKDGDYSYAATRELLLAESFEDNSSFFQFDWTLECTITAEVDNRKRTVTNIRIVEAELQQDGNTIGVYVK